jgi:hypothetical protein
MFVVVIVERGDTTDGTLRYMEVIFHSTWILQLFCGLVSCEWSGILGFGLRLFMNGEWTFDLGGYVGDSQLVQTV